MTGGRWRQAIDRPLLLACCDCGLTHRLEFRVRNNVLYVRCDREETETAKQRRLTRRRKR